MYLRTMLVLFIFLVILFSLGNTEDHSINKFLVVSTTEQPPDGRIENDHITKQQLQEALNTLNENIKKYLQKNKEEILDETETKLEVRFSKMKEEIIDSIKADIVKFPSDCKEIQSKGYQDSGVYRIHPHLVNEEFPVFCDMTTRGGGWTYLINRVDGSQNFYSNWSEYKNGFGNPAEEYWIGLERLYHLTNSKPTELLVELVDWDSKKVYAHYSKFKIGSDYEGYKLKTLGEYTGDAGDSFRGHLGNKFSTLDHDQDTKNPGSCANIFHGAWWYSSCFESHLTGRYVKNSNPVPIASGVHWKQFHGLQYSLKEAKMMIRPLST